MDKLIMLSVGMRKLLPLLFIVILTGCGSVTPIASPPAKVPRIKFETSNVLDGMQSANFDLNVGIDAIDNKTLFLFGSIGEYSYRPIQSTILRSEDGGQNWVEVMKPEQVSRVMDFMLSPNGVGWALVLKIHDVVGTTTLFRTVDFGKSWSKLSEIPKNAPLGFPFFMYIGEKGGTISMVYPYGEPGENYIANLSTSDGGKTWRETGRIHLEAYDSLHDITRYTSLETYMESQTWDRYGWWKIETSNEELVIDRRLLKADCITWTDWETITTLPIHLSYQNGKIVTP